MFVVAVCVVVEVLAGVVEGLVASSVAAEKVVAAGVEDPSAGVVAAAGVDDEPWSGLVAVAAVTAESDGVAAAVAGVDEVSLGLVVSAATVLAAGVVASVAADDEPDVVEDVVPDEVEDDVVPDEVEDDVVPDEVEDDESLAAVLAADDESLAAVLAADEVSLPVVDGLAAPLWVLEVVPDVVAALEFAAVRLPVTPGREKFGPGRRTVLLGKPPWRRGPAATVPLLAVLPFVLLALLESPVPPDVPAAPEPEWSGAAAAMPPLPARRTPLAITHAPNTALT